MYIYIYTHICISIFIYMNIQKQEQQDADAAAVLRVTPCRYHCGGNTRFASIYYVFEKKSRENRRGEIGGGGEIRET